MTKKKLTILQDMDSITVDLMGPWLDDYNSQVRRPASPVLKIEDIHSWDLHKLVPEGLDIYKVIEQQGFFRHLPDLPGAIEGTQELLDDGHDAILLTAGSNCAPSEKAAWVMEHMPFMKNRLIITHARTPKEIIYGDVLIDDGPHNISGFRKNNPEAFITGLEYPYTTVAKSDANVLFDYRDPAAGWKGMVAAIKAYAREEAE